MRACVCVGVPVSVYVGAGKWCVCMREERE